VLYSLHLQTISAANRRRSGTLRWLETAVFRQLSEPSCALRYGKSPMSESGPATTGSVEVHHQLEHSGFAEPLRGAWPPATSGRSMHPTYATTGISANVRLPARRKCQRLASPGADNLVRRLSQKSRPRASRDPRPRVPFAPANAGRSDSGTASSAKSSTVFPSGSALVAQVNRGRTPWSNDGPSRTALRRISTPLSAHCPGSGEDSPRNLAT
jgi:hypothetical protein